LKYPVEPTIEIDGNSGLVKLEFVLKNVNTIPLRNLKLSPNPLYCAIGNTVFGEQFNFDLSKQPHTIIAGTTGSGKTSLLKVIISNLLCCKTDYNDLVLIDPKGTEFNQYSKLINCHVVNTYEQTLKMLIDITQIMESRYNEMRKNINVYLKNIVIVIDEYASLHLQDHDKKLHKQLCFLAQKCRAAKIFIILATQRPSISVIDGNIKANFPARIACKVASAIDSKIILDRVGAEKLLSCGDALCLDSQGNLTRFQSAFI
jgi:S-DNA-T family DNA segregation ATPase FtsK/SpoIIIE